MIAIIYVPTPHGTAILTYSNDAAIAAITARPWSDSSIQTRLIGLTYEDFA